jgi:hypothetical protein
MPDADGLRLRAIRYLAMALKAREDGEARALLNGQPN